MTTIPILATLNILEILNKKCNNKKKRLVVLEQIYQKKTSRLHVLVMPMVWHLSGYQLHQDPSKTVKTLTDKMGVKYKNINYLINH